MPIFDDTGLDPVELQQKQAQLAQQQEAAARADDRAYASMDPQSAMVARGAGIGRALGTAWGQAVAGPAPNPAMDRANAASQAAKDAWQEAGGDQIKALDLLAGKMGALGLSQQASQIAQQAEQLRQHRLTSQATSDKALAEKKTNKFDMTLLRELVTKGKLSASDYSSLLDGSLTLDKVQLKDGYVDVIKDKAGKAQAGEDGTPLIAYHAPDGTVHQLNRGPQVRITNTNQAADTSAKNAIDMRKDFNKEIDGYSKDIGAIEKLDEVLALGATNAEAAASANNLFAQAFRIGGTSSKAERLGILTAGGLPDRIAQRIEGFFAGTMNNTKANNIRAIVAPFAAELHRRVNVARSQYDDMTKAEGLSPSKQRFTTNAVDGLPAMAPTAPVPGAAGPVEPNAVKGAPGIRFNPKTGNYE